MNKKLLKALSFLCLINISFAIEENNIHDPNSSVITKANKISDSPIPPIDKNEDSFINSITNFNHLINSNYTELKDLLSLFWDEKNHQLINKDSVFFNLNIEKFITLINSFNYPDLNTSIINVHHSWHSNFDERSLHRNCLNMFLSLQKANQLFNQFNNVNIDKPVIDDQEIEGNFNKYVFKIKNNLLESSLLGMNILSSTHICNDFAAIIGLVEDISIAINRNFIEEKILIFLVQQLKNKVSVMELIDSLKNRRRDFIKLSDLSADSMPISLTHDSYEKINSAVNKATKVINLSDYKADMLLSEINLDLFLSLFTENFYNKMKSLDEGYHILTEKKVKNYTSDFSLQAVLYKNKNNLTVIDPINSPNIIVLQNELLIGDLSINELFKKLIGKKFLIYKANDVIDNLYKEVVFNNIEEINT